MKKILFVLSTLTLLSYGCNRNEETSPDTGMQREERMDTTNQGTDTPTQDTATPAPAPGSESDTNVQKEETNPMGGEYRNDDVSTPVDERPELEEEE